MIEYLDSIYMRKDERVYWKLLGYSLPGYYYVDTKKLVCDGPYKDKLSCEISQYNSNYLERTYE